MAIHQEIEIKFQIDNLRTLQARLLSVGFRRITPRTHEFNTLYDLPGQVLRKRGEVLRLRKYGKIWLLTYKTKGSTGKHKSRAETETTVADGKQMAAILESLGFRSSFVYEKFRAVWSDNKGHVVIDETSIGSVCEIEGPARWIDATARKLGVAPSQYITQSYTELFLAWKRRTKSRAKNMTFAALRD